MKMLDKIFFGNLRNFFKSKVFLYLLLIIFVGFILRVIVASHLAPSADEAVYGTHAINFINSGQVSTQNQSPVWFFLADFFYKIFGISLFTARLTSVIFGIFTILVIYLLAKELFNRKIALIAASLLSISAFSIRYMVMEMDVTFTFFFFLSAYLFVKDLLRKNRISLLSAVFLGIAILAKAISFMLVPSFFLIYLIYYIKNKDKRNVLIGKNNIKRGLLAIIIVLILLLPILAYNYLLYKEKGLADVMFARFFNVSKDFYASIASTIQPFSFSGFFTNIHAPIKTIVHYDLIIPILSLIGVIIAIAKKRFELLILLSLLIPVYVFITGTSLLGNHFVVFLPILTILASVPLSRIKKKEILVLILIIITIVNIFTIKDSITSKSAIGKLREFAATNIDDASLVIADGRIYRGRIAWMLNDKHYVEASLLGQVFSSLENTKTKNIPIKTYFVECVKDDCGWGTIKDQPEFNQSMEDLVNQFREAKKIDIAGGGGYDEIPGEIYFRVYEATIDAKPGILQEVDKTHQFFFYPVRWTPKEVIYDTYTPKTFFDKSIDSFSRMALYLAVIIALLSIPYTLYLILKSLKNAAGKEKSNEAFSDNTGIQ